MSDISDLLDQFHEEGIVPEDEKPIPYLGWWWREIDYAAISYHQRKLWVDAAKKWGYPMSYVSDTEGLREDIISFLEEHLESGKNPDNKEFQRLLFDYSSKKFKSLSREEYYMAEWDDEVNLLSVELDELQED